MQSSQLNVEHSIKINNSLKRNGYLCDRSQQSLVDTLRLKI